jgi:hypothetical protein
VCVFVQRRELNLGKTHGEESTPEKIKSANFFFCELPVSLAENSNGDFYGRGAAPNASFVHTELEMVKQLKGAGKWAYHAI